MWRIYAFVWLDYLILLALALQVDDLANGHFNWHASTPVFWSIPQAFFLALLWPLSGYLERKHLSLIALIYIHIAGAFLSCRRLHADRHDHRVQADAGLVHLACPVRCDDLWRHRRRLPRRAHEPRAPAPGHRHPAGPDPAGRLRAERTAQQAEPALPVQHPAFDHRPDPPNPEAAETALFQFSDMLRYVLDTEKSGSDRVTLEDELGFVRDYLELESLRLGPRLKIDWQLDDAAAHIALPALSLQPLVENSIKHAFNPHSRPGRLRSAPASTMRRRC
jgi:hypothetical protein